MRPGLATACRVLGAPTLLVVALAPVSCGSAFTVATDAGPSADGSPDATTGTDAGGEAGVAIDGGQDATIDASADAPGESDAEVDGTGGDASAGSCAPGSTRCAGSGVQTCTSNGTWGAGVPCSTGMCVAGRCAGSCTPGATECSGTSVLQNCGPGGTWSRAVVCTGQACVQSGSTASCQGVCTPGTTECGAGSDGGSVNGVSTCTATGTWSPPSMCASETCVSGACTGQCAPGQTNPVACGNCGTDTQTCSATGAWQAGTCTGQGACVPGAAEACNAYGTQSCGTGCAWGACSCPSLPVCTPGATTCSGAAVETCGGCGQWGAGVPCASGACLAGACVAEDAGTSTPPSCLAGGTGLASCGALGDSCCTSLEVPAGTYERAFSIAADGGATAEASPASVSGFRLDKYEVTVGRFRQFVSAWNGGSGWLPAATSGKHAHLNGGLGLAVEPNVSSGQTYEPGWVATDDASIAPTAANLSCETGGPTNPTWTASPGAGDTLPINCTNWYEAYAFCIWDGGFLPSESEWEYVAAGGTAQREYPWGGAAPGTASQYAIYDCYYPGGTGTCTAGVTHLAPVGTATLGAALWGQLDLAGNLYEWALDWQAAYATPCTDCALTTPGSTRSVRGGDFYNTPGFLLTTFRGGYAPTTRNIYVGIRCARTP